MGSTLGRAVATETSRHTAKDSSATAAPKPPRIYRDWRNIGPTLHSYRPPDIPAEATLVRYRGSGSVTAYRAADAISCGRRGFGSKAVNEIMRTIVLNRPARFADATGTKPGVVHYPGDRPTHYPSPCSAGNCGRSRLSGRLRPAVFCTAEPPDRGGTFQRTAGCLRIFRSFPKARGAKR
jgi:hypothetical protein